MGTPDTTHIHCPAASGLGEPPSQSDEARHPGSPEPLGWGQGCPSWICLSAERSRWWRATPWALCQGSRYPGWAVCVWGWLQSSVQGHGSGGPSPGAASGFWPLGSWVQRRKGAAQVVGCFEARQPLAFRGEGAGGSKKPSCRGRRRRRVGGHLWPRPVGSR